MPEAGDVVDGRYRIVSRVGSGGMADVFLAEDDQLGRQVALKFLHRRYAEDQEFVERFRREASSAAGLAHANVVSVFDRGEWDGTYYIAMEYLPGRSLKTVVREEGALAPERAIDIVQQILRAARFAHQRGVIHRDLKPHNVIVDDEGRVRVTDFGIARAGASDMTETGSIMGTAQYLSPEQAQGHAVSAASDIYAVGIVLYELLTGVLPFDGETAVTIALKQVAESPRPPSVVNPAVPTLLDGVVLRALAKEPSQRYADAEAFILALDAARASLGGDAQVTAHFAPILAAAALPAAPAGMLLAPAVAVTPGAIDPLAAQDNHRWWWVAGVMAIIIGAVAVLLLTAKHQITVPALTRCESARAAVTVLRQRGLQPRAVAQPSTSCPSGQVVAERPAAGSRVDRRSVVTLVVSSGPTSVPVPSVLGQPRATAMRILTAASLRPTAKVAFSPTVAAGRVVSTLPTAGTPVSPHTAVLLTVSGGPQPVSVPSVTGLSQAEAQSRLAAAKLQSGNVTPQISPHRLAGTVLRQSVAPGRMLPPGSTVDLVVAVPPQNVAVPDVVNQAADQAAVALTRAGFAVVVKRVPVTDPNQDGTVLRQKPGSGHRLRRGAKVTLTVGRLAAGATTPTPTTATTTTPAGGATTTTTSSATR